VQGARVKIKEVMERPVFVSPEASKKELIAVAKKNPHVELFIVVDKDKKFLGDIHENDLFLMMIPNDLYDQVSGEAPFDFEKKFFAETAQDLMRKHDVSCDETDEIMDVAVRLAGEEVNEMPVLNKKGQVVGVINEGTLLRYLKVA
jgi:CBS domain-containing protein